MTTIINGSSPSITFSDGSAQTSATRPFLNRLINGNFVIDQRNAGASVTPANLAYTLDRWKAEISTASKFSVQQSSTAPAGFNNSLLITSSSAYTVGAADYFAMCQPIEGYNIADLGFGTANAKTVTISFWVRSSVTGTYSAVIVNQNDTRVYPFTYTINSANTFEYKTVTIPGDTTGTWLTTNGAGIRVNFYIGLGTNFQGAVNAWNGGTIYGASGTTNLVSTNGATLYLTGVQLEVGSTATSFDYRPYGTELSLCQRYYETSYNQGSTPQVVPTNTANSYTFLSSGSNTIGGGSGTAQQTMGPYFYKVTKRAVPTVTIYSYTSSATSVASNGWTGADLAASTGSLGDNYAYGFTLINSSGGNVTTGGYGIIFGYASSAEL